MASVSQSHPRSEAQESEPSWPANIAALNGRATLPSTAFRRAVSGSEAQHLSAVSEKAVKAERKVLIGFRLGDLWTDIFTYSKGEECRPAGRQPEGPPALCELESRLMARCLQGRAQDDR